MKTIIKAMFVCALMSNTANATKHWYNIGTNWQLYFDNGKAYIRADLLSDKCNSSRAFVSPTYGDDTYREQMYAYVLSASVTKQKLSIVLDDALFKDKGSNTQCEYFGVRMKR